MIIEVEQGSDEWKGLRRSKVTATDCSVILGNNPFKTLQELWEEKLLMRPEPVLNDAMRRGQELEPIARQLFNERHELKLFPVVYQSDKHPWQLASLDGWYSDGTILEIKCPNEKTHKMALAGLIPEYYKDQIQHQFSCTGADICYYCSYRPDHKENSLVVVKVYPNPKYIAYLEQKEYNFFFNHMCLMCPPLSPWTFKEKNKF